MKETPSEPSIETAKEISNKFQKDIVILITLDKTGCLQVHSYGKDKPACSAAGKLGEFCFNIISEKWSNAVRALKEQAKNIGPASKIILPNSRNN
jgi:hypothetical protein